MKTLAIFVPVLAACSALFFFAPHHRRNEDTFKACTLGEIYQQLFSAAPEVTSPGAAFVLLLGVTGVVTAFYPALLVALAGWCSSSTGQPGGALFVFGGLTALVGAVVNFIAIIASHLSLGWGTGGSTGDETPFCWIIPLVHLVFGMVSFGVGCSATVTGWVVSLAR